MNRAYSYGMGIKSRAWGGFSEFRYSVNGQEKDDEISGKGNMTTATFWEYDTRLGRRWNVDPIRKPWESSYATFGGNPIVFTDPFGDDERYHDGKRGRQEKRDVRKALRRSEDFRELFKNIQSDHEHLYYFNRTTKHGIGALVSGGQRASDRTNNLTVVNIYYSSVGQAYRIYNVSKKETLQDQDVSDTHPENKSGGGKEQTFSLKPKMQNISYFEITSNVARNQGIKLDVNGVTLKPGASIRVSSISRTYNASVSFTASYNDGLIQGQADAGYYTNPEPTVFSGTAGIIAMSVPVITKVPLNFLGMPLWNKAQENYRLQAWEKVRGNKIRPFK